MSLQAHTQKQGGEMRADEKLTAFLELG